MIVVNTLRGVANLLDPPPPLPPRPPVGDDDRQAAALGLLDEEVEGWVLCEVRRNGAIRDVTIKGDVPDRWWLAVAVTLREVADAARSVRA